jgi:hypothetical protein
MMRVCVFTVAAMLLGVIAVTGQTQPPNSTTLCPVTHDCRTVGQGALEKRLVPAPAPPAGTIQCPPGTYQIPNTNRCRVK